MGISSKTRVEIFNTENEEILGVSTIIRENDTPYAIQVSEYQKENPHNEGKYYLVQIFVFNEVTSKWDFEEAAGYSTLEGLITFDGMINKGIQTVRWIHHRQPISPQNAPNFFAEISTEDEET